MRASEAIAIMRIPFSPACHGLVSPEIETAIGTVMFDTVRGPSGRKTCTIPHDDIMKMAQERRGNILSFVEGAGEATAPEIIAAVPAVRDMTIHSDLRKLIEKGDLNRRKIKPPKSQHIWIYSVANSHSKP